MKKNSNQSVQQEQGKNSGWLDKKLYRGITPAHLLILAAMLLSLILHLVNVSAIGDGNNYYTAAVKSMLQSWKNFFFMAAEPGGSVTVDKPPLGFWIETAFAYCFGVSGFVVSLPNIISGILSIPLLFHLTRKYFGTSAGIVAGWVYAVTPVVIAADRNNTIDAMLVFTLLLAAWAFIRATESGKFTHLALASVLVGLAFNIKMMQAYLPLPAFFALYFFGSKHKWGKRILNLSLSALIILAVSLSWALAVDFTPSDQRPYVGGSDNNTVTELIIGYNGLSRLFGQNRDANPPQGQGNGTPGGFGGTGGPGQMPSAGADQQPGRQTPNTNPENPPAAGGMGNPPAAGDQAQNPANGGLGNSPSSNNGGAPAGDDYGTPPAGMGAGNRAARRGFTSGETGQAGALRLFQQPLVNEMSWLLPFGLIGILILASTQRVSLKVLSDQHKGVLLWGTWLVTCLVFFSVAGFFHSYYLIMFAAPLAVMTGGCFHWFEEGCREGTFWKKALFILICGLTLAFQVYTVFQYLVFNTVLLIPLALFLAAAVLLVWERLNRRLRNAGTLALFVSLLLIPSWWSVQTALNPNQSSNLPAAYSGDTFSDNRRNNFQGQPGNSNQDSLITYLQEHTQDTYYMVAVESSTTGAPIVLETGRPVLYMGGFAGGDPVVDADDIASLVGDGKLRYVLSGGSQGGRAGNSTGITSWLSANCTVVTDYSQVGQGQFGGMRGGQGTLYECQP